MMKDRSRAPGNLKGKSDLPEHPPAKARELVFSFRDFDPSQGQTFTQWGDSKLLRVLLDKIREYSRKTIPEAQIASFRIYGTFPPHSRFTSPRHITPDATWASMHIQGKECIAGHVVGNIFYVVFLDREHHFWPTEKKHT
jgi:hypothetical protein